MSDITQHQRYDYLPITQRKNYDWPDGKRLAIYIGVNHEVFSFGKGLGAELAPSQTSPDVMNYAWRDYGNRVGAWRFMEMFKKLELKTTALMNSAIVNAHPELAKALVDQGDEIAAHGVSNSEAQGNMTKQEEQAMIEQTLADFKKLGVRPKGWLGPWISESNHTPDLLQQAGFTHVLDWAHDDQPIELQTSNGNSILSIPYSQEINDIPSIIARNQEAKTFASMIEDSVTQLLSECHKRPIVLGIALHPYVMGQAHRALHLERVLRKLREQDDPRIWWTSAGDIADFVLSKNGDTP